MKILCLDGGGIRGAFAIAVLHSIEREWNKPIAELFDMIAGTSTGAIIAASAVLGIDMQNVLHSYKIYGNKIFVRKAKFGLLKSVYSDEELRKLLMSSFGEITLGDIRKPLLIPTVDVVHGKPVVHRTNFGFIEKNEMNIKIWDAVLSSCSAPIYFPPNNIGNEILSIDGGLWANNPSLVCITEALNHFQQKLEDIRILSIGTGQQKIDFKIEENKYWGIRHWMPFEFPSLKVTPKLLDLAMDLSSESISYHSHLLLKENYLRINQELSREVPFDDVTLLDDLVQLGLTVFENRKLEIERFLTKG